MLTLTTVLQSLPLLVHKSSFLIARTTIKTNKKSGRKFDPEIFGQPDVKLAKLRLRMANLRVEKITVSWLVET